MKKTLAIVLMALVLSAVTASGQDKGDISVSGSLSISGGNMQVGENTTPYTFAFGIEPRFGYFVMDRLEVSVGLGYDLSRTDKGEDTDGTKRYYRSGVFSILPKVSYYVPIGDKFYYTPSFMFGVGFGGNRNYAAEYDDRESVTEFSLSLVFASFEFRPTERIGLTFTVGSLTYDMVRTRLESKTPQTTNKVDFGLSESATVGFKYYF